jgi:hypothetical protein
MVRYRMCKLNLNIIYKRNKINRNWTAYTKIRNKYKSLIRRKNCEYYRNKIICYKDNPKKLWKILKSLSR